MKLWPVVSFVHLGKSPLWWPGESWASEGEGFSYAEGVWDLEQRQSSGLGWEGAGQLSIICSIAALEDMVEMPG